MPSPKILITGATGLQGGAVIDALVVNSWPGQILALTRDINSSKAKAIAAKPNVTVIQGNPASPAAIFAANKPIDIVFLITAFTYGKENKEEEQAVPMITEALKAGVKHFILASVDRGGIGRSDENPTKVPHFSVKHRMEILLKEKTVGTQMGWTFLRPVVFMDNLTPDFNGKLFTTMWRGLADKPLQLISTRDIGIFGARVIADPVSYNGRAISLAGDELTFAQAKQVFEKTFGYDIPVTFSIIGTGMQYLAKEMGTMFAWFKVEGFGADIGALREEYPKLQDFGTWLKESSAFTRRWSAVSPVVITSESR
jgi:uncharacterized protein YbjT (DUF2867 family)